MAVAKAKDLKVRPLQSVDLCFEVDGVLAEQNPKMPMLGLPVTRFDFLSFYGRLGVEKDGTDPGRLKFDSQAIHDDAGIVASVLFALRAEPSKAGLDKAIAARENSFYQRYKNQAAIIQRMRDIYTATNADSKPDRLAKLQAISQSQRDDLDAAYAADKRTGVIRATTSDLIGAGTNTGKSDTSSTGTVVGSSTNSSTQKSANHADNSGQSGATKTSSTMDGNATSSTDAAATDKQSTTNTALSTSTGSSTQTQSATNTDYAYRHPRLENDAQYQRAQISLLDEQFSQFMLGQNLPLLDRVFANELRAIDLDVRRLQIAYLNTILMSPIDGVVTGVFKNLGDCVRAGEPVMRVENDAEVFLVGTIICRDLISIGSKVSVTTQIFGKPTKLTISGLVVSVRGHDSDDDEWNVLVRCANPNAPGGLKLPINYNFDYDDTTVTVS
jgi:multidrug resistance efflux pump